jgi:ubiquinone/menaquinone biosynthesis C-methylase UbiE
MAAEVLQSEHDIERSRGEMISMGIDCTSPLYLQIARTLGLTKKPLIGDRRKSWDILKTIKLIQGSVAPQAPVLDIGAYASEVLCALHRLGYSNLTGVDLNPDVARMPYTGSIRYVLSDFMHMPFQDASFEAITAISVIEHGYQGDRLLHELSRVLKPGGLFIASVDYWPDKIDTTGITAFGMDWRIFSKDELKAFMDRAAAFGFSPVGEMSLSASTPLIDWQRKQYTFCWFAIRKRA